MQLNEDNNEIKNIEKEFFYNKIYYLLILTKIKG